MKRLLFFIFLGFFSWNTNAQKVTTKNNIIIVDKQEIAQMERDGCKMLSTHCNYYIRNMEGESLINITQLSYNDPLQVSNGNENGMVRYLRLSFSNYNGIAEIPFPSLITLREKDLANVLVRAQLIKDGQLDIQQVENYVRMHGTQFSDRAKEIKTEVLIIR